MRQHYIILKRYIYRTIGPKARHERPNDASTESKRGLHETEKTEHAIRRREIKRISKIYNKLKPTVCEKEKTLMEVFKSN